VQMDAYPLGKLTLPTVQMDAYLLSKRTPTRVRETVRPAHRATQPCGSATIASISTRTPSGRPATAIAARAGGSSEKNRA